LMSLHARVCWLTVLYRAICVICVRLRSRNTRAHTVNANPLISQAMAPRLRDGAVRYGKKARVSACTCV
jgi:hypothetical protein